MVIHYEMCNISNAHFLRSKEAGGFYSYERSFVLIPCKIMYFA